MFYGQPNLTQQPNFDIQHWFKVPISKVIHTILINENVVVVVHHNYEYTVLRLYNIENSNIQVLGRGQFPELSHSFIVYSALQILFMSDNSLYAINWLTKCVTELWKIPKSEIYQQKFWYKLNNDGKTIMIGKNSMLYRNADTIGYEINVCRITQISKDERQTHQSLFCEEIRVEKIKTYKFNLDSPYQIQYCCGEPVIIRKKGYKIDIKFLESQIQHQVNSIAKLMLIQTHLQINTQNLILLFTKDQISENQLLRIKANQHQFSRQNTTLSHKTNTSLFSIEHIMYPLVSRQAFDCEENRLLYDHGFKNNDCMLIEMKEQGREQSYWNESYKIRIGIKMKKKFKFMFLIHNLNRKTVQSNGSLGQKQEYQLSIDQTEVCKQDQTKEQPQTSIPFQISENMSLTILSLL